MDVFFLCLSLAVVCLAIGEHIGEKDSDLDLHREHEMKVRAAVEKPTYRWENGVVNVIIENDGLTSAEIAQIWAVLREIEDHTKSGERYCVRFVEKKERDPVTSALRINKGRRCLSPAGRENVITRFTVDETCLARPNLLHEFMHVLGFYHEHSRPDRDNYVSINYTNVDQNVIDFFNIRGDVTTQNLPYDYESILQYQPYNHAVDPSWPTIYPKKQLPTGMQMGPRNHMSKIDVLRIQRYYSCPENTTWIENVLGIEYAFYCDFEDDWCNMTSDAGNDFDWSLGLRGGSTPGTGPHRDRTSGIGQYLVADAAGKRKGMKALVRSPEFEPGQYCLRFALYFYGADIGQFSVHIESVHNSSTLHLVPLMVATPEDQEDSWVIRQLAIKDTTSLWTFLMEAEVGKGPRGDVAVDDIRVYTGDCS